METNSIREIFGGTHQQLIATVAATLSAISDGMQYGWSAPVIPLLESEDSPIRITKKDETWLEIIYLMAGVVGLPITIYLVNKIGRQKSILFASILTLLSWIIIAIARRIEHLYLARFLTGLSADVAFVSTPMYVSEIAEQKIRGFLSSGIFLMMLVGILLIYSLAPFVPFYVPSLVAGSLLLTQLLVFPFMPESPYYLLIKGKKDLAKQSLNKLRSRKNNDREFEEIAEAVERQQLEKGRLLDLFIVRNNRRAFFIVLALTGAQHFCGISVMLMNLHSILIEAGSVYLDSNSSAIIFSAIMLVASAVSSLFIDKYGRKFLLVTSCILTGLCLLSLAIYFNLKSLGFDTKPVSWIPLLCVMLYGAVFKYGLGLVPIVIASELFSTKIKAIGMSLSDGMYVTFGLISIALYQKLANLYGYHCPFYLFSVFAFAMAVYSVVAIPETKGKSLEEIQALLRGNNESVNNYNSIS